MTRLILKPKLKPTETHDCLAYIVTNINNNVLYMGVANDLKWRLFEHDQVSLNKKSHFTGKYNTFHLIYGEKTEHHEDAIAREKEIKRWVRIKEERLISEFNPEWTFLNNKI